MMPDDEASGVRNAKGALRSLSNYNYRIWAAGALVSNTGTWMQRIAQDWLVLTQLTNHDATAVGIVTGLQFAPRILFFPWVGHVADQFDRRKLLIATQLAMGVLALGLGILTVTGLRTRPSRTAALAAAHEDEPEAWVSPAPRSQMRIKISCGPVGTANCTFVRLGNNG